MADTAAESQEAPSGSDGAGAPNDAPPARVYNDAQVNAIAAKHKREGEKLGRKTLLETYGVENEEKLAEILNAHRTASELATQEAKPEAERKADKFKAEAEKREAALKAQAESEKAALKAQLEALQMERDSALVRDVARKALSSAGLVSGAEDLVMAALGIGESPEHRMVVRNGAVVVVDKDGDEVGVKPEDHVTAFLKPRLYLHAALGSAPKPAPASNGAKPRPTTTSAFQRDLQELARVGQQGSSGGGSR